MAENRFLIAAGGTGGHIFPAIHVSKSILAREPNSKIMFVGTGRPLEDKLIAGAGFELRKIKMVGVSGRGLKGALEFMTVAPAAVFQTWRLISEFKPDLIFGFGGYGSFLPLTLGALRGIPTWIHEAEASPGLANKILGLYVDKISTAFNTGSFNAKKSIHTGHPVREDLLRVAKKGNLSSPPHLLIVGGSQGARSLDNSIIELAPQLAALNVSVLHQTRPENQQAVAAALVKSGVKHEVTSFISEMASAYDKADVVIARSGAGTVAELSVINRPSILVPLPSAQGGHQLVNAKCLADVGKGVIVEEGPNFGDRLLSAIKKYLEPSVYGAVVSRPGRVQPVNAADAVAEAAIEIVAGRRARV
jgi:UDP-N-acetylglucosamine--N-acetylmuramyl-(pentapeptide) pyrophosphoryl-undecaprenol N-acetylglucosamine transferase